MTSPATTRAAFSVTGFGKEKSSAISLYCLLDKWSIGEQGSDDGSATAGGPVRARDAAGRQPAAPPVRLGARVPHPDVVDRAPVPARHRARDHGLGLRRARPAGGQL